MIETKFTGKYWQAIDTESGYGFVGCGLTEQEAIEDLKKWMKDLPYPNPYPEYNQWRKDKVEN